MSTQAGTTASQGMFGNLGNWWDEFGGSFTNAAGTAASIYGALDSAKDTKNMGAATQDYLSGLGANLQNDSQFQGYGVSSGLGNGSVVNGPNGVQVDLGMNLQAQNQMNNMQNNYALSMQNAANAYNSAGNINSGQTATDFNAMSSALQGAANGINPAQGAFGNQAQIAASQALANPSQRQGEIYSQMMNMQRPELDRMAAQSNAQEYAMGRGGVMGSQYGGTAEDAAMSRARAQASNQASLNAMQQADSERSTFGQMASQFGQLGNQNYANMGNYANQLNQAAGTFGQLGNQAGGLANDKMTMLNTLGGQLAQLGQQDYQNSFMPMSQQMAAMELGMQNSQLQQGGQLQGNDYLAQMLLGGVNANINANHSANELTGSLYNSLLGNIGGTQGQDGSSGSGLMGAIGGGIDSILGLFGKS